MSRNRTVNEHHPSNDVADIKEVTQLCHEYSSERENFHKLGFQCLLKKLKEIEKIILAISKMSGNDGLQIQENTFNVIQNDIAKAANSSSPAQSTPEDIHLPDDLTFHSKHVLQIIFQKFESDINSIAEISKIKFHETLNESYCEVESTVNVLDQKQSMETKNLIEGLLSADVECVDENNSQKKRHVELPFPFNKDPKLHLPEDLTSFTKSVLNEIFENYRKNVTDFANWVKTQLHDLLKGLFSRFEQQVNGMKENQKSLLRQEMEKIFVGQNGSQVKASVETIEKTRPTVETCVHLDLQLARRFEELNRLVGALLDKNESDDVIIDENKIEVINENEAADSANIEDELADTQYKELPKRKKN